MKWQQSGELHKAKKESLPDTTLIGFSALPFVKTSAVGLFVAGGFACSFLPLRSEVFERAHAEIAEDAAQSEEDTGGDRTFYLEEMLYAHLAKQDQQQAAESAFDHALPGLFHTRRMPGADESSQSAEGDAT